MLWIFLTLTFSGAANAAVVKSAHKVFPSDEVYVKDTGLVWARCSLGQSWDGTRRCVGPVSLVTYYEAQRCIGGGWRLPTRDELKSIVEPRSFITINPLEFPNIDPKHAVYWTGEEVGRGDAWSYGFKRGVGFLVQNKRKHNALRLVHDARTIDSRDLSKGPCPQGRLQ